MTQREDLHGQLLLQELLAFAKLMHSARAAIRVWQTSDLLCALHGALCLQRVFARQASQEKHLLTKFTNK